MIKSQIMEVERAWMISIKTILNQIIIRDSEEHYNYELSIVFLPNKLISIDEKHYQFQR